MYKKYNLYTRDAPLVVWQVLRGLGKDEGRA